MYFYVRLGTLSKVLFKSVTRKREAPPMPGIEILKASAPEAAEAKLKKQVKAGTV